MVHLGVRRRFVGDGDDGPSSAFFSFLRRRRSSGLESENHPGAFSTARPVVRARVFSPRASTVSPAPVTRNTDRTAWFSSAIFAAAADWRFGERWSPIVGTANGGGGGGVRGGGLRLDGGAAVAEQRGGLRVMGLPRKRGGVGRGGQGLGAGLRGERGRVRGAQAPLLLRDETRKVV